ncbi:MAG TPA: Eco57I restriction-modification methylase domain-containing protein, partial [Planctomycetaceae bacterium]|nr:Eco57I restriction-modification methylase domain-containing protein [Planctomycetaceae bacterium]
MRNDSTGLPMLIRAGNLFVTVGTNRRSTGSHYTPVKLTEPIVRHTLAPLVYEGLAEGQPPEKGKLRSARQLLDLKICDMACGAGAFLVQACRYLSERLLESWENGRNEHPGVPGVLPYGDASTGARREVPIPDAIDARRIEARRIVAQRCLYGVDKNPLSIEIAKLSLALLTLSKDKPFAFLDHCLRCGDSLVGISRVEQVKHLSLQPDNDERHEHQEQFAETEIEDRLNAVTRLRRAIQEQPSDTPEDIERKQAMLTDAEEQTRRLKDAADLLVATNWPSTAQCEDEKHGSLNRSGIPARLHWPLEFPEVFLQRDGFDAVLGNPPFINAIEGRLSAGYKAWLASRPHHLTGTADLAFHFLAQADHLTRPQGAVGLLMPRPFLNAKAGSQLRLKLLTSRAPAVLFSPEDSSAFAFANVKVVAVILFNRSDGSCTSLVQGKPRAIDIQSENWWSALAASGRPTRAITCGNIRRVADVFEVGASMTAGNAYDLKPIVHDRADTTWPRLVTTGLIDPGKCLWGEVACRYLKSIYGHPVICPSESRSADLRKRLRTATRPKILVAGVAGPGGGLEAFVDERGLTCGAVSTYTITHPADSIPALQSLCDFLNSPEVTALVFTELHASSMGSGLLTIKKAFLTNLCLPARRNPPA